MKNFLSKSSAPARIIAAIVAQVSNLSVSVKIVASRDDSGARLCAEHQPQHSRNTPRAAAGSATTAALLWLRREARRHAAWAAWANIRKAVSPLRSATALQNRRGWRRLHAILIDWKSALQAGRALGFALALFAAAQVNAAETGKTFATPETAVAALAGAVMTTNRAELHAIFGPAAEELVNPDAVQAANEFAAFAAALGETNRLVRESETRRVLELGSDHWPFPVPIVQKEGGWMFDTAAGTEELLNRRIGRNELETLQAVRTYVQAQREYASHDRDGDDVLEYAQNVLSTPGNKDGLYWSPELDGDLSPLGPLVAAAQAEGYRKSTGEKSGPQPFHGYLFKILTSQGNHAPGGKYNYVVNGNMIGGFALIAWPASYGETGIMTFIVNQQGRVYQKDLGPKTARTAAGIKSYDPDKTWTISPD